MSEKQFVNPVDAKFTVPDYIVFSLMLGISCGIGIFHALTGGKQKTTLEFLMANRNMNPFPVGMSLVASFISAITFLGTPADNYKYGIGYWLYAFGYILVGLACWRFYIPIFYRMKITSANEVRFIFLLKKTKTTWVNQLSNFQLKSDGEISINYTNLPCSRVGPIYEHFWKRMSNY